MDLNEACKVLEIKFPISQTDLKKKYRIMALKFHPDKHIENKLFYENKFKEINESYHFINNIIVQDDYSDKVACDYDYNSIVRDFIKSIFSNNSTDTKNIINKIIFDCQNLSANLFENMDKEKAITIYEFIAKNKHILYLSDEVLNKIRNIINDKFKDDNMVILNPNVDDLLSSSIYVLKYEDQTYYIPLWHYEVWFKHNNNDLLVKCIPQLPDNMIIDEFNNLIVTLNFTMKDIFDMVNTNINEKIIHIGKHLFRIPINELKINKKQKFVIKSAGPKKIDSSSIYESLHANIIFDINLF